MPIKKKFVASTCSHGDVRLFGGYVSWEGTPQVCINGQWVTGCRTNWNINDSTTFCSQLLQSTNISKLFSATMTR